MAREEGRKESSDENAQTRAEDTGMGGGKTRKRYNTLEDPSGELWDPRRRCGDLRHCRLGGVKGGIGSMAADATRETRQNAVRSRLLR